MKSFVQPAARRLFVALVVFSTCLASACNSSLPERQFEVMERHPHDTDAFTQGLVYSEGVLYESTGLYGQSRLRKMTLTATEPPASEIRLPARFFGEGLALVDDELYQLTWRAGRAFVYDAATLGQRHSFRYEGEGWGLTYDGVNLILSDGSPILKIIDPQDFRVLRTLSVEAGNRPIKFLNELEYVEGFLFANILGQDRIVIIEPQNGQVTGWLDLSRLRGRGEKWKNARELNGIAYDREQGHLLVTGKNWPYLFALKLADPS